MKALFYTLCYLIYPFSFLFVRSRRKYAFGSYGGAFNDNAKYLFVYVCRHCPDVRPAWISSSRATVRRVRELGLPAFHLFSPRGAWHALTSRYWFFNSYTSDIFYSFSGGAVCFNLWHGLVLKRIEYNIRSGPVGARYQRTDFKEVYYHPQAFRAPDYVVSSSPSQTAIFASSFRIPAARCLEFGYPRNEILTAAEPARTDFIRRYEPPETLALVRRMQQFGRVLVYMPTWRDSQRHIFTQSMDLGRLNEVLRKHGEMLLLKPHANVVVDGSMPEYSNILFLPGTLDVYPLLPYTHVLITDYSSVLYDYLLMDGKAVILYLYDHREYLSERDLIAPFDDNVVGRRAFTFEDLLLAIDSHDYAVDGPERAALVEKYWGDSVRYDSNRKLVDFVRSGK